MKFNVILKCLLGLLDIKSNTTHNVVGLGKTELYEFKKESHPCPSVRVLNHCIDGDISKGLAFRGELYHLAQLLKSSISSLSLHFLIEGLQIAALPGLDRLHDVAVNLAQDNTLDPNIVIQWLSVVGINQVNGKVASRTVSSLAKPPIWSFTEICITIIKLHTWNLNFQGIGVIPITLGIGW
ncbi:hypothetical protein WICPIJ_005820 [Wickerhamomyces pijperi]|uniref:Uncharacterized protein n=1 Tax=Wickerhamomyces pijperi TaxID=599730 RepID=A0A9P8Q2W4_WICPI|nr:hypothetical protein WICPIJ_005820 [Wickerhamomyces pijperi]